MAERAGLRRLAEAAKAGSPMDPEDSTGAWEAWFNFHGDPYVVEAGRGQWGTVATINTVPEDYGKSRAEFMGAADPNTVLALLDVADAAARILHPARGDASWLHTAEFDDLRAALAKIEGAGQPLVSPAPSCPSLTGEDTKPQSTTVGPGTHGPTTPSG